MPKLPIFRLRTSGETPPPDLRRYQPALAFSDLQLGVDNLRYDVSLGARFTADLSFHLARLICHFGEVETLLEMEAPAAAAQTKFARTISTVSPEKPRKPEPANLKTVLLSIHQAILARAKAESNPSIDVLGRLAVLKFIRAELQSQFARILEQCRTKSKLLEGVRPEKMLKMQERVSLFQVRKKTILRSAGQEVLHLLGEIEKETLARTRRSLLGELKSDGYHLLLNPLILTDDGRDDYLCAEHYYMFGNFEKDPDRFSVLRRLAIEFLRELGYGQGIDDEHLEQALNVPENARALVGSGNGECATAEDRNRKDRLGFWTWHLQREGVLQHVIATYEAVPLLAEYVRHVNPQQLKNALVDHEEAERVEEIAAEESISSDRLWAAIARVASCRGSERERFAARLFYDLFCYHRDLRGLEAVNAAFDSMNLVGDDKVRELSSVNGMLYEFLPLEDQKPAEDRVLRHTILKADIRDSSRLTRSLMAKSMNAASYFSLNFYDPINKMLAQYEATKVFLEGDAIIVALFEREAETMLSVGRACVLACEIVSLLRGYNELLRRSGLPSMEVGLGISYQDSPPLYLMDGDRRIMISDAINESDRLASCNKRARGTIAQDAGMFHVYGMDACTENAGAAASADDLPLSYNVGGICLSEAAFSKLQEEIALEPVLPDFDRLGVSRRDFYKRWLDPLTEFFSGTVPIANGAFRKIVVRKSRVAQIDVRDISFLEWSDRCYYEVCVNPVVHAELSEGKSAAARKR